MKRITFALLVLLLMITACSPQTSQSQTSGPTLTITFGDTQTIYNAAQLQALGAAEAIYKDVTYLGVPLVTLLQDAGIDPEDLTTVQAVATDDFAADYDATVFMNMANIVAYAQVDGPLDEDEQPFRMVLPEGGGKENIRMLVEIITIP